MSPALTEAESAALLHMLGLDERHREPWRNHYVGDCAEMRSLLAAGLVEERRASELTGGEACFIATEAGKRAAMSIRVRWPKPSRSAGRYAEWLNGDGCGVTFGEFLRRKMYEVRP